MRRFEKITRKEKWNQLSHSICCIAWSLLILVCIPGCAATQQAHSSNNNQFEDKLDSLLAKSKHQFGLSIYDPRKKKIILNHQDDHYFIPASNAKLLTMHAAIEQFNNYLPAAYYLEKGDTLIFWGAGDPGTYYPDIHKASPLVDYIKSADKKIVFSNDHFVAERFGTGWAWDDFTFDYQVERTAYPIYGNQLWVEQYRDSISLTPGYWRNLFYAFKDKATSLTRNEWGTQFEYRYNRVPPKTIVSVPVTLFENDIRDIWEEATGKEIEFRNYPLPGNTRQIQGSHVDTLIKHMMYESDNFIAEQLLLAAALDATDTLQEEPFITHMIESIDPSAAADMQWVDGSGLSRYNLISPAFLIHILESMLNKKGLDYMLAMLPAGGQSGTLKDDYKGLKGVPYLYAKSGSMQNQYCVSGILLTRSQKVLLFPWMNNAVTIPLSQLKREIEDMLVYFRDQY